MRFDHHQPERLGPVDREEQGFRTGRETRSCRLGDLADELDERIVQQRSDGAVEVVAIGGSTFAAIRSGSTGRRGDRNRAIDALLGRDTPEKREICARGARMKAEQTRWQTVMHGRNPSRVGQGLRCASEMDTTGISENSR